MSRFMLLVILALVGASLAQLDARSEKCKQKGCDPSECKPVKKSDCKTGTTATDECGCCEVCAKGLYDLCTLPGTTTHGGKYLGRCGEGLECRLRDDLPDGDQPEAMCFCQDDEVVCGSDGITYDNPCHLAEQAIKMGATITPREERKPCPAPPKIVSPPEHTKNNSGTSIALVCEAQGFPIPTIEWSWTRVDGHTFFLPSDDLKISVNMRGGPEKTGITGWMQIMDMEKHHEGDYTCHAHNEHGEDQSTARVNVVDEQDDELYRENEILRGDQP